MTRERKTYSREFRIKAVELSNERGSLLAVAQELNIKRDTLKRWKKEYSTGKLMGGEPKPPNQLEEENKRLRKELFEAKQERDILKKAVGIFTKSDK
jgi:transposase